MANRYRPHLLLICEDDPYRDIARAALNALPGVPQVILKPVARGWSKAIDAAADEVPYLTTYGAAYLVLLLDFDGHANERHQRFREALAMRGADASVLTRCFLFGIDPESEELKRAWGYPSWIALGEQLVAGCCAATGHGPTTSWRDDPHLAGNQDELARLYASPLYGLLCDHPHTSTPS